MYVFPPMTTNSTNFYYAYYRCKHYITGDLKYRKKRVALKNLKLRAKLWLLCRKCSSMCLFTKRLQSTSLQHKHSQFSSGCWHLHNFLRVNGWRGNTNAETWFPWWQSGAREKFGNNVGTRILMKNTIEFELCHRVYTVILYRYSEFAISPNSHWINQIPL